MRQLQDVWGALDPMRRLIAIGVAVAVFVGVLALARGAAQPSMALLYAGLAGPQAGQVIAALDQRNLRYEVRGDAIYVEAPVRDATRMALAGQGLPANSAQGYELLDGLSGFGTTSQMFDAAYWRAKEGELARTITASPLIQTARVHIAQGAAQPFRRDRELSASVTVTPAGGPLPAQQAQALRFLVASAVAGLSPEDVAVIDANTGLVAADPALGPGAGDRAAELRRNVERLLEARVGPGRAVVEVAVETVTDRETIVERRIDPDSRIAMTTDSEERTATSTERRTPPVSVASNLPDGEAAEGGQAESRDVQTRSRTGYEVSQTSRELQRAPGAIRRLTVAVLVDGTRTPGPDGTLQWSPRPDDELEALRELVASAVGFDADRGDVITLRSLPFEGLAEAGTLSPGAGLIERLGLDTMALLRLAALAAVVLILALFVLRPLLRPAPAAPPRALPPLARTEGAGGPVLDGEIEGPGPIPGAGAARLRPADEAPEPEADPVARMRALIAGRQTETLEILRGWMDERGEARPTPPPPDGGR